MTGYIRKDTTNNIADGNVINATDLDNEFDGVQAAFVVATGHTHDGTASEGAAITKIGPVQDVVVSIASMSPKTTNTIDLGTSSLKYKDAYFAGNETVGGTLAVTGVTTLTAQPVLSSLTASQAVFTNASKGLVSNAITGTGNVVMSTSPTLVTPILGTPQSATLTNAIGLPISTGVSGLGTGIATALAVNVGSAGAPVINGGALGTPSSGTVTNLTGTASININGTVGATTPTTGAFTTLTTSSTVTLNGGTANGVAYLNGSKVLTTGSALTFDGTNLGVGFTANSRGGVVMTTSNNSGSSEQGGYTVTNGNGTGLFAGVNGASYSTGGIGNSNNAVLYTIGNTDLVFGRNTAEQMRLTSTGLGIGTSSPTVKLDVQDVSAVVKVTSTTGTNTVYYQASNTGGGVYIGRDKSTGGGFYTGSPAYGAIFLSTGAYPMAFAVNSVEAMRLDASGNLGLGVVPSAWGGNYKGFQVASTGAFASNGSNGTVVAHNAYYDGTDDKYLINGAASRVFQFNGGIRFDLAGSGTAGAPITFTQAMTLDASGNLLVGGTSQLYGASGRGLIQVSGSTDALIGFGTTGNTGLGFLYHTGTNFQLTNAQNGYLSFGTNNTERARIDSSGNFAVGSSSPVVRFQAGGATGTTAWSWFSNNSTNPPAACTFGTLFGTNLSQGNSEANLVWGSGISSSQYFAIGKWSGSAYAEQVRIDYSGNLLVGRTSSIGGARVSAETTTGTPTYAAYLPTTGTETAFLFVNPNGTVGSITTNGSATLYNVTSDQRLKENISDAASASALIDNLQVRQYNWKSDGSHQRYGFIAQELVAVAPEAVHQPADPEDMMAVDYSKLVPMLVKEIQSLRKRLAAAGIA